MSSLAIRLNKPCRADEVCEGPYSYRHFLSLTNNSAAFSVSEMKLCQTVLFEVHVSVPIKLVLRVYFQLSDGCEQSDHFWQPGSIRRGN